MILGHLDVNKVFCKPVKASKVVRALDEVVALLSTLRINLENNCVYIFRMLKTRLSALASHFVADFVRILPFFLLLSFPFILREQC